MKCSWVLSSAVKRNSLTENYFVKLLITFSGNSDNECFRSADTPARHSERTKHNVICTTYGKLLFEFTQLLENSFIIIWSTIVTSNNLYFISVSES
jgi:hypothetical protein